jgi:two-component sensor histidine kinase
MLEGDDYRLEVCDDGPGPGTAGMEAKGGLGLMLMHSLARGLGGAVCLSAIDGAEGPIGARFELRFPSRGRWA